MAGIHNQANSDFLSSRLPYNPNLFSVLNHPLETPNPNCTIHQKLDPYLVPRFSWGRNGRGTVDPMDACAFEIYHDDAWNPLGRTLSPQPEEDDSDSESESIFEVENTRKPSSGPVRRPRNNSARIEASPLQVRQPSPPPPLPASAPNDPPKSNPDMDKENRGRRIPENAVKKAIARGAKLPPDANVIPKHLQYMLLLGCEIRYEDKKPMLACKISATCPEYNRPKRPADCERHLATHFRSELDYRCEICSRTFSRKDPLIRHQSRSESECYVAHPKC
ncbi:C2H2-type domain-containing protein [Mycena indigotica]|uniref:C2H2-type domain-containing protein n=1 Tax=Mycena indigotica TaxID=2126181 RepID=A0A8H6SQH5_9AGAR|nr:C2H2-type domain-containing protein [Mycena indigotica]KAF7303651.1 C2H2-type domain-containing protein [Mycena indigotica]